MPLAPRVGNQLLRDINNSPGYRPLLLLLDGAWRAAKHTEEYAEIIDAARLMILRSPSPEELEKRSRRHHEQIQRLKVAAKHMKGNALRMQQREITLLKRRHKNEPIPELLTLDDLEKDPALSRFSPTKLTELRTRALDMEKLCKKEDATTSALQHQMLDVIIAEALRWPLGSSLKPFIDWASECKKCGSMHEFNTTKWPQWLVEAHERRREAAATSLHVATPEPELAAAM